MKNNRRDFLKMSGLGGLGFAFTSVLPGCTPGTSGTESNLDHIRKQAAYKYQQQFNMAGYAAPAIDVVRVGVIGLGNRGTGTVRRLASIEGVNITALCDIEPDRVSRSADNISATHSPAGYSGGEDEWKRMCERDDIDLVAIATPWHLHAVQAIYAMEHEKHVYVELPAANTIEECWQLVETSEKMRKHLMQVSSSCHSGMQSVILNMARNGVFGEIIHGEGAYIHDLMNDYNFTKHMYHNLWRLNENIDRQGSLYPQHGLVPVAQMMDLNCGDQMDHLISMSTKDFMMGDRARELAAEDDFWEPYAGRDYRGNLNTTLIRTHGGRTIMIQHDVTTPRPGVRFNLLSGTRGTYMARPDRIGFSYSGWIPDEEFRSMVDEYSTGLSSKFGQLVNEAREAGLSERPGHSYAQVNAMDWRLIDCLRNGLPLDMNVYDAALTSAVTPLSEWSAANGSAPINVPDFTGGSWKTNPRGMDIDLRNGGGNTRIF